MSGTYIFLRRLVLKVNPNMKAFVANRPLGNSTGYIVNQFEHVWECGPVQEMGPCSGTSRPQQTDRHDWKHYLPTTSLAGSNNCKVVFLLQIFAHFLHNVADVWATMPDFTSMLSRDSAWILYMEDVKEMIITSKPLKNVRKRVRTTLVSQ